MSVGDGVVWSESLPDNSTLAHQIDDYDRDLRVGVRSRMAHEHVWGSSQTGTAEGGFHKFITFQSQTATPTLIAASNQVGCLFVGSSGAGYPLVFENSAGSTVTLVNSAFGIPIITTGTQGGVVMASSANPSGVIVVAAGAENSILTSHTTTGAADWKSIGYHLNSGITVQQATGTTDITGNSSFADMTDMSLSVVVATGDTVIIDFNTAIHTNNTGAQFSILRDSTTLATNHCYCISDAPTPCHVQYVDTPAAGTYTYKIQWRSWTGGGGSPQQLAATDGAQRNLRVIKIATA